MRAKYYREIKKFISIPKSFKGLTNENPVFAEASWKTSSQFYNVYLKSEELFKVLDTVRNQFVDWVVFGTVDMESISEQHVTSVVDWEKNFKMIKMKGRGVEKLPT